jgi:hypothetical protein
MKANLDRFTAQAPAGSNAPKDCTAFIKMASARIGSTPSAKVENPNVLSVRVDGDHGFVIFKSGKQIYNMPLASESGTWKISAVSPIPLGV